MAYLKRNCFLAICGFFFLSSSVFAAIFTCNSTKEIPRYVDKETLVIFDIGNTIYTNAQMLGSPCWLTDIFSNLNNNPYVSKKEDLLTLYRGIQRKTHVRLVETITPSVIDDLHRMGCHVICVTLRDKVLADATFRQMNEVGVRLYPPCFVSNTHIDFPSPYGWKYGIFFTSGLNKEDAILLYLKETGLKCKKVVMIDDAKRHFDVVERALESIGVSFVGLLYAPSFKIVQDYDQQIASIELDRYLQDGVLISDEEARRSLK